MPGTEWERVCEDHPRDPIQDYPELRDHAVAEHGGDENFAVVWRRHRRLTDPPRDRLGWA